jgi:hypothetical protein
MPQHKPFGATSNPIHRVPDATKTRAPTTPITPPNRTLMNDMIRARHAPGYDLGKISAMTPRTDALGRPLRDRPGRATSGLSCDQPGWSFEITAYTPREALINSRCEMRGGTN